MNKKYINELLNVEIESLFKYQINTSKCDRGRKDCAIGDESDLKVVSRDQGLK
jgi:hypothetical protein